MLHAIDYHTTLGHINGGEHHSLPLPPIPANHTRLLASDWAHLDVWEEVSRPATAEEMDAPGFLERDDVDFIESEGGKEYFVTERRLQKQGVVVKYEQERDALPKPVVDPLPGAKAEALAKLASLRYDREVGGFDYMGKRVMSDRESQAKIQGLMVGVQLLGDTFTTVWKCVEGWLVLDKASAIGLVASALQHVSGLYVRESQFVERIHAAATVEEVQTILTEF